VETHRTGPNFRHDGGFAYDLALSFLTPLTLFGLLKSREFLGSDFRAIEVPREGVTRTSPAPATPISARDPGKLPILTNNAVDNADCRRTDGRTGVSFRVAEVYRPISGAERLPKDGSASFLFSFEVASFGGWTACLGQSQRYS
jgi:hypothetical protein